MEVWKRFSFTGNHDVRLANKSYGQKFYDSSLSHELPYKKNLKI